MRHFTEYTAKNLLRTPLVMGVSMHGFIFLIVLVLLIKFFGGTALLTDCICLSVGLIGYCALRVLDKLAHIGWEEKYIFLLEKWLSKKDLPKTVLLWEESHIEIKAPDTLDQSDLIFEKEVIEERISKLKSNQELILKCEIGADGARLFEKVNSEQKSGGLGKIDDLGFKFVYSLIDLPVNTDPYFTFNMISRLTGDFTVFLRIKGLDFKSIKKRIEISRKRNAGLGELVSDVDSEVTFEEASSVLQNLSRGSESVVQISMVIASQHEQEEIDETLFCRETDVELSILSVLGVRKRFHRDIVVRSVTASDIVPSICDPNERTASILKSIRGYPLYFTPTDARLEALHWLVVGASGSGKSFFTGLVLNRLIEQGEKISVLFVDHNRSFRRLIRSTQGVYLEPQSGGELQKNFYKLFDSLSASQSICGIELSDLAASEKKAATHFLLQAVESFLRNRDSLHPVYVVLDECWNFLRDEPVLVQRAFREFRKLNGAVVAITQSLSDFVTDQTGQSIFQNAPVRILLRQGEDLSPYKAALGVNDTELNRLRFLKQRRGEYSECLIKTPFLSKLGRLYPTEAEHSLLRTDNLRAELVNENKMKGAKRETTNINSNLSLSLWD